MIAFINAVLSTAVIVNSTDAVASPALTFAVYVPTFLTSAASIALPSFS